MKKKGWLLALLLLFVFAAAMPMKADAAWKVKKGNYYYYDANKKKVTGWKKISGKKYYFNKTGIMQTGWQRIGKYRYYFSKNKKTYGAMQTGWCKISKKYFYFTKNGRMKTGWVTADKKKYYISEEHGRLTGKVTLNKKMYIFNITGVMQTKWYTDIDGNKYYAKKSNGVLYTGLKSIGGKKYYFDSDGIMQKNMQIVVKEQWYDIDENGVCAPVVTSSGDPEDMLFFTKYESGDEGYAQTGGDSGNACGKYQFDYRYSLLPFVKFCYSNNPTVFAGFKKYAAYSSGAKLQSNKSFYKAWQNIYKKYPVIFKDYQDAFAIKEYYTATETHLNNMGLDITKRPYVVKGAVFSYSIQHGSYTAALHIKAAKITNSTSNKDFINKMYKYRWKKGWKKNSLYKSRYQTELKDALAHL